MRDRASEALAESPLPGEPRTYEALSKNKNVPLSTLHHRAQGRRSREEKAQSQQYLTPAEENALEKHLTLLADLGNHVRIKFIPSLAFCIARQRSSTTDETIKPPGKNWVQGFVKRHPALKSRRVRALDWQRHDKNIYDKVIQWFDVIGKVLLDPAILPENVYNMDETGVMLCKLGSVKVLTRRDDPRDYRGAKVQRTMITAIECMSADGRSLLPMIIWPASTHRSNWTTFPTPGWHYARSESGYTDSEISFEWLTRVFDPQTKERANGKPRVLICDGFGTHESLEILEFCFENNITLCRLPSHTSHKLQPCDVGVFAPLKEAYRDRVDRLCRAGTNTVGKQHFTYLYSPAREKAFTKRNMTAGWAACGLFPYNPDRVLRTTPKPPAPSTVPEIDVAQSRSCPQDLVIESPVTPVSAKALSSLFSVLKQDTDTLTGTNTDRLQKRIQKIANAAQVSFAELTLLREQNEFLMEMNNEAKVRRETKSRVVGTAKVMSYEDIEEARAKRIAKDARKGNGKRGRKRKSAVDEPEPEPQAAYTAKEVKGKRGRKRQRADTPEPEMALVMATPFEAPVARMF